MNILTKVLISFPVLSLMFSCSSSKNDTSEVLKATIMNEDREFCKYALKEGFFNAFLKYADKDIVKFSEGQHASVGIAELRRVFDGRSGTKSLSWEPVDGKVAESGELGYTWGKWKLSAKDSAYYGNYFTLWKRQNDGTWKVLLDGGNSTPPD